MRSLFVTVCLVAPLTASAGEMFLKAKEVTVTGMADVAAVGGKAAARDAAIKNAQRNAIETVMGAVIESAFSAEQKETIKKNQTQFESKVEEKVYSKSAGFIQSQKILSEGQAGGTYEVKLRAVVKAASLKDELGQLQAIFKEASYPKVMLMLTERYTNKDSEQRWIERPSITALVEEQLINKGFALVAKDQMDQLRAEGLEAFAEIVGEPSKAAEIASKYGAEVVITGSSEVRFTAYNELGNKMYYLSTTVNLRAVNASSAKILASFEEVGKGTGASEELGRVSAVKKAAPGVVAKLIDGMVTAWQREAEQGRRFVITIMKVRNYRRHARPLIKAFEKLDGVEAVKELNFGGKRLELEVIYNGTKKELFDGIFDEIAAKRKFRRLDKVMDRGNTIELSL